MPRNTYDTTRIRFATGAAGGTIAYRPDEVLIRTGVLGDDDVDHAQRIINLVLHPAVGRVPGAEVGSLVRPLMELVSWLASTEPDRGQQQQEEQGIGAPDARERILDELDSALPGSPIVTPLRLRRVRRVNDGWSVFGPEDLVRSIDPIEVARVLSAAGLTAQPNYVRFITSLQSTPNYIAPNYIAPNYIAPNYIAPNYIAPNYIAPNYIASGAGGGACLCEPCPEAPHVERRVPTITARGAYGPLPGPAPTTLTKEVAGGLTVEIHVLDVRFQASPAMTPTVADALKAGLKAAKGDVDALAEQRTKLVQETSVPDPGGSDVGRRNALLPLRLRALAAAADPGAADEVIDAAVTEFLEEPTSPGLGANFDEDGFVDPTTNHAEFIQGIIDRIVLDTDGKSTVRHHAIAGTLGEVDDADLAMSIDWVVDQHTPKPRSTPKLQVMNLSLSGYTDDDRPDPVLADSIEAAQAKKWLIVASAGNNGSCRLAWPAALKGVVSVAAYGPCGPAFFSNHGPWVDACGPGVDVVSTFTKPGDDMLNVVEQPEQITVGQEFVPGGYAAWSGTSFSAPYVAAMIVLRAIKELTAAGVSLAAEAPVDESRIAERWQTALREMISDDDLLRLPGYGTIVSSDAVKVTTTREQNAP